MHDLEGNLGVFEPIPVFQMLNLAQATGELELKVEDNSASVFFDHGNVSFAAIANRPMRLGEYLVKEGLLDKKELAKTLRKTRKGKRLGAMLVEEGLVEEEVLHQAIVEQIKEVIYNVVRWREGRFVYTKGKTPKKQDIRIDIPLDHLMLEGLKRMDEEQKQSPHSG
jgi:hypothetical protein